MKTNFLLVVLFALLTGAACSKEAAKTGVMEGLAIGNLRVASAMEFHGDSDATLAVRVFDRAGKPVAAKVTADYKMPAMGSMAEMRGVVPFGDPAAAHTARVEFDMAGKWFLRLVVHAGAEHVELHYAVNTITRTFVFERSVPPAAEQQGAVAPSTGTGGAPGVPLSDERRQLIGVKFATAEVKPLRKSIRAFGRVLVSEQSLASVTVRTEGWVKELFVQTTGARVRKGDPLFRIYSPELNAAQQEFLISLQPGAEESLRAAGAAKLRSLGMSAGEIERLRSTRELIREVVIRSPQDGIVISKDVVAGARLEMGMTAFQIGNLGKIWVLADLFEQDAPLVKEGYAAMVKIPGTGAEMRGTVGYVYPSVDENTRTLPVRLEFRNAAGNLKPGMYVDVFIELPPMRKLVIPRSAVLVSGEHSYVFVDRGNGNLEPREIETGLSDLEQIEVVTGVMAGERVSSSANFLISSEALLQNALPKWKGEAPSNDGSQGHNHGGGQ